MRKPAFRFVLTLGIVNLFADMTYEGARGGTTAVALSWAWRLLADNAEAEQKLHEELHRVLGGRAPAISDLPLLPYSEGVIKEPLRLYPPGWAVREPPSMISSSPAIAFPPTPTLS